MKVHVMFEFDDDARRLLRSAQGRGGKATRAEFKVFARLVLGASMAALRPSGKRGLAVTAAGLDAGIAAAGRVQAPLFGCTSLDHVYPAAASGTRCYCGARAWGVGAVAS